MMSIQNNRITPSLAPIWFFGALVVATGAGTVYQLLVPVTARTLVGFGLGLLAVSMSLASMLGRVIERMEADERAGKLRDERSRNTGTWTDDEGRKMTVRYAPGGRYYVAGYLGAWNIDPEERWANVGTLARVVEEAERTGFMAGKDEGTRSVRARLDVDRTWPSEI